MQPSLKSLREQVIVLTGATSGIGLATARLAAQRGAKLVLAARNDAALRELAGQLRQSAEVELVVADVADEAAMREVAATAVRRFGGFDTWINNAGTSIYGPVLDVPLDEQRRVFETNFWGVVIGSRVAAEHFRAAGGGAIINVGSVLSDQSVPLQGAYAASKHAVKAWTDALRMELEHDGAPVSVTLIKPSSIDTPFPQHARNHMPERPTLPAPAYAPRLVAENILYAAEHPIRTITVGAGGWILTAIGAHFPSLTDFVMSRLLYRAQQQSPGEGGEPQDSLFESRSRLRERGDYRGTVFSGSLFTEVQKHPLLTTALLAGGLAMLGRIRR